MGNTTSSSGRRQELIAFRVGEQEFCVDIMAVREIRGWTPATRLPHAQNFMRGVINLRGTVLPIVDLSARLGFGLATPQARHVIIVVRTGDKEAGLLVDAVCDILSITEDMVQPTPNVASDSVHIFVRGILAVEGRLIGLIGLEHILPEQEALAA